MHSPEEKVVEEKVVEEHQPIEGEEETVKSKLKDNEGEATADPDDVRQSLMLTRKGSIEESVRQSPGFCFITRPDLYKFAKVSSGINTGLSTAGSSGARGKSDMFQHFSTILYVHFRNSRKGKSTSGVGNSSVPHPLNTQHVNTCQLQLIIIIIISHPSTCSLVRNLHSILQANDYIIAIVKS